MQIIFIEKTIQIDKLGISMLSSILKDAGHSVDLLVEDRDDLTNYDFSNIDFIMFSVLSPDYFWFVRINDFLQRKYSHLKTVVGGPHFTFFPEDGIENEDVDYVMQGPAESCIVDMVEGNCKDKFVKGSIYQDLNKLPFFDRELLYKYDDLRNSKIKRFISCRHCPHNCSFCHNHIFHELYKDDRSRLYQSISPENMVSEIKMVKEKYGFELAFMNDDDFLLDENWVGEFCDELLKEDIEINFYFLTRVNRINDQILDVVKKAHCSYIAVGIESYSDSSRKLLNKHISNDQIEHACAKIKEKGILLKTASMVGLPVDDPWQDALDTLKFNQKLSPDHSLCMILQAFPGTKIFDYCVANGFLSESNKGVELRDDTQLNIKNAQQINNLRNWWDVLVQNQVSMEYCDFISSIPLSKEYSQKLLTMDIHRNKKVFDQACIYKRD